MGSRARFLGASIAPDSDAVAVGIDHESVYLFSISDRFAGRSLDSHSALVGGDSPLGLAFNGDGSRLAATLVSSEVVEWSLPVGDTIGVPTLVGRPVRGITFNHDGSAIAVSGAANLPSAHSPDSRVLLFDPATMQQVGAPLPVGGPITGLAFSQDGKTVISANSGAGGGRGNVQEWTIDPAILVGQACEIAGRALTMGEWQKYAGSEFPYSPACGGSVRPRP